MWEEIPITFDLCGQASVGLRVHFVGFKFLLDAAAEPQQMSGGVTVLPINGRLSCEPTGVLSFGWRAHGCNHPVVIWAICCSWAAPASWLSYNASQVDLGHLWAKNLQTCEELACGPTLNFKKVEPVRTRTAKMIRKIWGWGGAGGKMINVQMQVCHSKRKKKKTLFASRLTRKLDNQSVVSAHLLHSAFAHQRASALTLRITRVLREYIVQNPHL